MARGHHSCPVYKCCPGLLAAVLFLQPVCVHADVCVPQCHTGRGICVSGQCFCHNPWGGAGCSSVVSGVPLVPAARDVGLPSTRIAGGETTLNKPLPDLQSTALPQLSDGQEQQQAEAAPELVWSGPDEAGVAQSALLPSLQSRKSLRSLAIVQQAPPGEMDAAKGQSQAEPQPSSAASTVDESVEPASSVMGISNPGSNVNIKDERASLRQELEQLNADANTLQLKGDPVAEAVLRDLKPVGGDLQLIGSQAKSKTGFVIDSTVCIAAPVSVQAIVLAVLLIFAAVDRFSKDSIDGEIHRSSWTCGCCLHIARFIVQIQWHTIAFGVFYLLVMDGTWAVMCMNGTASDYLSTVGIYAYLAFAIFGLVFLFLSEIYLRCAEQARRFERLSSNVSNLVGLLDVKYGKQLQKRKEAIAKTGHWAADKVDDLTDAMGITEASSEDDVSCWNGCRAPGPRNIRK